MNCTFELNMTFHKKFDFKILRITSFSDLAFDEHQKILQIKPRDKNDHECAAGLGHK